MEYLHRETGGGHDFDDFVAELVAHPRIKDKLTPLQKKETLNDPRRGCNALHCSTTDTGTV